MLLAQPFDPFKEKQQQQQQRKLPLLARFRIISRTRRALLDLKNKVNDNKNNREQIQAHFMLPPPPPPPQPWYSGCYGCCYDPYMSQPMMIPTATAFPHPPPPPLTFGPIHHQLPYTICVHITSPPSQQPYQKKPQYQQQQHNNESSSLAESTLYSSSSSMYSGDEKELIEEVEEEHVHPLHHQSVPIMMTRSNSDITVPRRGHTIHHRPSFNRWSSDYYN
jgi:hypothetical protein